MGDCSLCARPSSQPEGDDGQRARIRTARGGEGKMNSTDSLQPGLRRIQSRSLVVGLASLGINADGGWLAGEQFIRSCLIAYLFWLGIALGCIPILILYHV